MRIVVLKAREDLVAARAARELLGLAAQQGVEPFERAGRLHE